MVLLPHKRQEIPLIRIKGAAVKFIRPNKLIFVYNIISYVKVYRNALFLAGAHFRCVFIVSEIGCKKIFHTEL